MDGVVVIVKYLSGGYAILGAENGLYKTAQSRMVNEESGLVTVTYETREGMEEMLSERVLNVQNIDGSIFVNMEAITGLVVNSGESVVMATDSTKKCLYYNTVTGETINSTSGAISDTADGTGEVVLFFEKNAAVSIAGSDFGGQLKKTITTGAVSVEKNAVTSLSAKNSTSIDAKVQD